MFKYFTIVFIVILAVLFSCQRDQKGDSSVNLEKPREIKSIVEVPFVDNYPNGNKKFEGNMLSGKRNGAWKAYYEDGTLWSTGFYLNGLRDGISILFHQNGKKFAEGSYKNNEQIGIWFFYDDKGMLLKKEDLSAKK